MIEVVVDLPGRVLDPWRFGREMTLDLPRWEALDEDDSARVRALVDADLVPWVLCWPAAAIELLRNVMSVGLTSHPELLQTDISYSVGKAESLEWVWRPLWEGVFGDEPPDQLPAGQIHLVADVHEQFEIELRLFGGRFVPPDPVDTWDWLRPAHTTEVVRRMSALSGIGLHPSWNEAQVPGPLGREWVHKNQGRVAIDVAAEWFRSGHQERWTAPAEGLVEIRPSSQRLSDPLGRVFATPAMAVSAPAAGYFTVLKDGTMAEPQTFLPMSDLVDVLADAARALEIPDGDLLTMAASGRELEVARPSQCEVYLTWAVVAEALHDALENELLLRFWTVER